MLGAEVQAAASGSGVNHSACTDACKTILYVHVGGRRALTADALRRRRTPCREEVRAQVAQSWLRLEGLR